MPIKGFNYRSSLFGNYNQQSPLNRYDKGIPRYAKGYFNFMKDCLTLTLGTYGKNKSPKEAYDEAKAILKATKAQDGKRDETKLLGFFKKAMKVQNQVGINQMVAQAVKRSRQIKKGMIGYDERYLSEGGRANNKWHIINQTIAEGEKDNYGEDGGLIFHPHAYDSLESHENPLWDSLNYSVQFSFDKDRQIASTRDNDFFEKLFSGAALDELTYTDLFKTPENRLPQEFQIYMTIYPTLEYKLWSDYTGDAEHENRQKLVRNVSNKNITCYDLATTTIEAWENTEGRSTQGIHYDLEIKAPTKIEGVPWLYTFGVNLGDNTITWQIAYDGKRENVGENVNSIKNIIENERGIMGQFMDSLFYDSDHKTVIDRIPLLPFHDTKWEKHDGICQKSEKEKYESVIKLFSTYGIEPPMYILVNRNDVGIINHPFF